MRDNGYIRQMILNMEMSIRRKRGSLQRRFLVKKDLRSWRDLKVRSRILK